MKACKQVNALWQTICKKYREMGGKKGRMIKTVKTALDLIHYETGKNSVEL